MKNNSDEMIKNLEFMKTPLGKKSVLNQDEWNYVHSNSFKNVYGDWESKVKKDFLLSNNTVAELTGNEFSKIEGMSLTDQVEKYFSSFGNTVSSPFFGNVILGFLNEFDNGFFCLSVFGHFSLSRSGDFLLALTLLRCIVIKDLVSLWELSYIVMRFWSVIMNYYVSNLICIKKKIVYHHQMMKLKDKSAVLRSVQ